MKMPVIIIITLTVSTAMASLFSPLTIDAPVNETIEHLHVEDAQEPQDATTATEALHVALFPVCSCESSGSPKNDPLAFHYESDGVTPLIGRVNPKDRGMCQINLDAHLETTKQMGLDILENINDYIHYSNFLYQTQGLRPWRYSQHCWDV